MAPEVIKQSAYDSKVRAEASHSLDLESSPLLSFHFRAFPFEGWYFEVGHNDHSWTLVKNRLSLSSPVSFNTLYLAHSK